MSHDPASHPSSLVSSAPLSGERVTFTGVLASMTHAEAAELVRQQGGEAVEHVSRHSTMLVVGEEGWPLEDDGQPSLKLQQALDWQARGATVRIVKESDFLRMVGLAESSEEVRRLHTPAMLSQLLDVPVHVIRGWERAGLVQPVKRVHRLPYFDFQEVSSARRLSELLQAGVPREEIERSLKSIPGVATGERRPFEQLEILARDRKVVIRDRHGLRDPRGQRLLTFDSDDATPPETEDEGDTEEFTTISFLEARQHALDAERRDWLVEGCRHADEGELAAAIEAFRIALMFEPQNPEVHFQLGDALYRKGRVHAALERFYAAAELDHDYLEAWTQIGALHRELGEPEAARDAFAVAIDIHEDSPEVQFQMAETLAELGRTDEAIPHWEAYLEFEQRGPWAELARRRIRGAKVVDEGE
jgi:DNA-binding transcriptional MerR regulator